MKKNYALIILSVIAAAMLISCIGAGQSGSTPAVSPEAANTETAQEAAPAQRLWFTDEWSDGLGFYIAGQSSILFDENLKTANVNAPEFDGDLFAILLYVDNVDRGVDEELSKELERVLHDTLYRDYMEERSVWIDDRENELTDESELEGLSEEEITEYLFGSFDDHWRENHTPEECERLDNERKLYDEAKQRYNRLMEHGGDWAELKNGRILAELERLGNKGVIILGEADKGGYYTIFPAELLRDFPENILYGYRLVWLDPGIIEDPEWNGLMKERGMDELVKKTSIY